MLEAQLRAVHTKTGPGRAAVKGVSQYGKTAVSGVNADLMGSARDGRGLDHRTAVPAANGSKQGFGHDGAGSAGPRDVLFPGADEGGPGPPFLKLDLAGGPKQVFLLDEMFFKLAGKRAIGRDGFSEDDQPGGVFVETVKDGKGVPGRVAISEPLVNALAGEGCGGVSVPAGWLVCHQQVFIFKEDQSHGAP